MYRRFSPSPAQRPPRQKAADFQTMPAVLRRGGSTRQETTMGLLDVLNGMQQGPRGPSTQTPQTEGGGMSPMTMAILALLAWKAVKHFGGSQPGAAPAAPKSAPPQPSPN